MLVVKKIETAHMSDQEKTQASREVELHTDLRHQHIVQYISHFVEDATLHIVMQYVKQRKRSMRAACSESAVEPDVEPVALPARPVALPAGIGSRHTLAVPAEPVVLPQRVCL